MKSYAAAAVAAIVAGLGGEARADTLFVPLIGRAASVSVGRIGPTSVLVIDGQMQSSNGAVSHTVKFTPLASILRGRVSWNVGDRIRLVGVNVDVLDGAGVVVASDVFSGLLSDVAVSAIDFSGLVPNTPYLIRLTGTQLAAASYSIALEFGPTPSAAPRTP